MPNLFPIQRTQCQLGRQRLNGDLIGLAGYHLVYLDRLNWIYYTKENLNLWQKKSVI